MWQLCGSLETYHGVRTALDMYRIDEPDALGICGHNDRMGSFARSEETDATKKSTVRYAGSRKNDLFAGSEVVCVIDLVRIIDPHLAKADHNFLDRWNLRLIDPEAVRVEDKLGLDLPIQTFHSRSRDHTLGCSADPH